MHKLTKNNNNKTSFNGYSQTLNIIKDLLTFAQLDFKIVIDSYLPLICPLLNRNVCGYCPMPHSSLYAGKTGRR